MISFRITFNGPFRIGTGEAEPGLDQFIDRWVPLPASSLKGLMKGEARDRLRIQSDIVREVFGGAGTASPWAWSDATFDQPPQFRRAARVKVGRSGLVETEATDPTERVEGGPDTADSGGRVETGFLMLGEHVWAHRASFQVVPRVRMDDEVSRRGLLVLRASARSVTSLGAMRRRGEGWVAITDDLPWTPNEATAVARLRQIQ